MLYGTGTIANSGCPYCGCNCWGGTGCWGTVGNQIVLVIDGDVGDRSPLSLDLAGLERAAARHEPPSMRHEPPRHRREPFTPQPRPPAHRRPRY